jgi:ATP-dependent Clp protease adaptor protein ClpS
MLMPCPALLANAAAKTDSPDRIDAAAGSGVPGAHSCIGNGDACQTLPKTQTKKNAGRAPSLALECGVDGPRWNSQFGVIIPVPFNHGYRQPVPARRDDGNSLSRTAGEIEKVSPMSETGAAAVWETVVQTQTRRKHKTKHKPKQQPRYHVILWDDDDHSYEYVVDMMKDLFGHTVEAGFQIAETVDRAGRAVCLTTTMEHAELKRDQIHSYGRDRLIPRCSGSMSASIEPESSE